jgi:thiosulfate/3-mercaptopyruvate sulfurtransferase
VIVRSKFLQLIALSALIVAATVIAACSSEEDATPEPVVEPTAEVVADTPAEVEPSAKLVDTDWMLENLDNDSVVVIDLRGEEDYAAGHIPGALRLTPNPVFQEEDENGVAGMLPAADHIASALSDLGIESTDTVVFYDGFSNLWASRALWALDVYGHGDTRLIDGSWNYWNASELESSTETPEVTASSYAFTGEPNTSIIAGWEEVLTSVDDPSKIVCDARSPEEFSGKDVRADAGGHIPEAGNVNWNRAVNEQGQFLPASELQEIYDGEGIQGDQVVFTLCQTAVRATHSWFVLQELLGYETVKVYDGSWTEWGNRTDLPITTR